MNRKADTRELLRPRVQYVFGQGAYELHLREVESLQADHDGRLIPAVRTAFEIRTLATDARTRFEITSGSEGDLLGVPVAISWQPRWWLRVSLRLDPRIRALSGLFTRSARTLASPYDMGPCPATFSPSAS